MNQSKRLLSLLLAVTLIIGLFPATLATAEPNGEALTAYLTQTPPVVDGKLKEPSWYVIHPLNAAAGDSTPHGSVGFLWDKSCLYVGLSFSDATIFELSVASSDGTAEKMVALDLGNGELSGSAAGARATISGNTAELVFPFSELGFVPENFDSTVRVNCTLRDQGSSASLTSDTYVPVSLSGNVVLYSDACDDYAAKDYIAGTWYADGASISIGQAPGDIGAYRFTSSGKDAIRGIRGTSSYDDSALSIEYDVYIEELPVINANFAWRGFVSEVRGPAETRRFSLTKNDAGEILFNVLYDFSSTNGTGRSESIVTGLREQERANIRVTIDKNNVPVLYVNGVELHTFSPLNSHYNAIGGSYIELQAANYNRTSGDVKVDLYSYVITRPLYEDEGVILDAMLDGLTFDSFLGENPSASLVTTPLSLPSQVIIPDLGVPLALSWSSSHPDIISGTGQVSPPETSPVEVTLTASLTMGGTTRTKDFSVIVPSMRPGSKAALALHDPDPYTGALYSTGADVSFTLDSDLNSVGLDMGSAVRLNHLTMKNTDASHRLTKKDLSLYVSDDNRAYRKVRDWDFLQMGDGLHLYNFDETTRYFKVHCHFGDNAPTFTNLLPDMISGEYLQQSHLLGANGGVFAKQYSFTLQNASSETLYDKAAYISKAELGLNPSDYRPDMADLRFVLGGRLLHHYYDGSGFFIRVPEFAAASSLELDVYFGNPNAASVSSLRETFRVEYGNKTVQDLTIAPLFSDNMKARMMPNGDLVAIANDVTQPAAIYQRVSKDGGRTWGGLEMIVDTSNGMRNEGGSFLCDGDRVYYFYFVFGGFNAHDITKSNCKLAYIYTDDSAATWSEPVIVETGHTYSLTYCNGLVTSVADGNGSNVDYVVPYHFQSDNTGSFKTSAVYSKDGGATWQSSASLIGFAGPAGFEGGPTEAAIVELADGRLKLVMRCQYNTIINFCETYSNDFGITWNEQAVTSNVYAPNTMPTMARYEGDALLLWGGNNTMGGTSYARYPLSLAYSTDDTTSWKKILDVYNATPLAGYATPNNVVQPDMTPSHYMGGDDYYLAWWNNWNGNKGILIEDFGDYLHKTQGAGDSFEGSSLMYEGWIPVNGSAERSTARSTDGVASMKIIDVASTITRVARSVPSASKGSLSFDVYLENWNTGFWVELKSAFNKTHFQASPISFAVVNGGGISAKNTDTGTVTPTGKTVALNQWNTFRVEYDISAGSAELFLNGQKIYDLPVNRKNGSTVAAVHFTDGSSSSAAGMTAYIDRFIFEDASAPRPVLNH